MFEGLTPMQTVTTSEPTLVLYGAPNGTATASCEPSSTVEVLNHAGSVVGSAYMPIFGTDAMATVGPIRLQEGWNEVCVVVCGGATPTLMAPHPVGANCIVMGYAP
jgi:hypothetical protein